MIILNSKISNKVYLTLSQDTLLTGLTSNYTLYIASSQQQVPVQISMTDISTVTDRYNKFIIPSSAVTISDGYYNYTVMNSAYSTTILETGKVLVTGGTTNVKYTNTVNNQTQRYINTD